jgi:acyl phosphate:glycerol-3-phosphate acyltransferase
MSDLLGGALLVLAGYLLGAIPVGVVVSRLVAGTDLRYAGSGRTGTTNALRALGPAAAGVVLVLDVAKGAAAVVLARWAFTGDAVEWVAAGAGVAAVIGHVWPVFIGFRGGRGVATGGGAALALVPLAVPVPAALLVAVTAASRYVSLGSLSAALAMPLVVAVLVAMEIALVPHLLFAMAVAVLVVAVHADNITRLRSGTERKIGQREASR